ncbi:hypothetical protein GCM10009733_042960 [Nonomuraea maheshkhaliensis]|uniref:Uncharacterized protein n=1 Tax=Nonomuraea maheshkhaliensis TaxID=419590 RepID=A0ABN2FD17_9ACTN
MISIPTAQLVVPDSDRKGTHGLSQGREESSPAESGPGAQTGPFGCGREAGVTGGHRGATEGATKCGTPSDL